MLEAPLFTWLQGSDFYRSLHEEAVAAIPPGDGGTWIDVGCGPGVVCRLAAGRGYRVTGIDRSRAMVRAARRLASRLSPAVTFAAGDVAQLGTDAADVVSACSLLAVLDDKPAGLATLWRAVKPGGRLLVVEATAQMTRAGARRLIAEGGLGRRTLALRLWAAARQGNAVDSHIYETITPAATCTVPLLAGMVEARVFNKAA